MEQAWTCPVDEGSVIQDDPNKRCGTGYAKGPLNMPYPTPLTSRLGRRNVPTLDIKLAYHGARVMKEEGIQQDVKIAVASNHAAEYFFKKSS